jgi:hypothetical protein
MKLTKIIFYDCFDLYKIFKELNDFFKFELESLNNEKNLKIITEGTDNFLIISNNLISNYQNQLIIDIKPIKIQELIEKIDIEILKNNYSQKSNIKVGKYSLNLNSREISLEKKTLKLTEQEIKMILYLIESKNPVTINELQSKIWNYASTLETHTVETHIHRLRKKILDLFDDQSFILSTKNGYLIN